METPTSRRVSFRGSSETNNKAHQSSFSNQSKTMNSSKMNMQDNKRQSEYNIPTLLNSQSCLNIVTQIEDETPYLNPEEYFRKVLDQKLLCFKCQLLYTDPISCYKCEKVYCLKCLEWELDTHSRCLYCFNIIFKDIAIRVNNSISEEYDKHEIKCPYRKCKEVKKLKDIRDHIEECLYRDDQNETNKLEHIEKVVCFDNDNDLYVQNHLMIYFKKQYEDAKQEKMQNANQLTNRTNRTMKTMKSNRTLSGSIYSRYSNKSNVSQSQRKSLFNYKSFLDETEFNPKSEDLKKIIDTANEYIGKTVFDLASKTKETNERLKKMVNK